MSPRPPLSRLSQHQQGRPIRTAAGTKRPAPSSLPVRGSTHTPGMLAAVRPATTTRMPMRMPPSTQQFSPQSCPGPPGPPASPPRRTGTRGGRIDTPGPRSTTSPPGWTTAIAGRRVGRARASLPSGGGAMLAAGHLPDHCHPARPDHDPADAGQDGHRGGEAPNPGSAPDADRRARSVARSRRGRRRWGGLARLGVPALRRPTAPTGHAGRSGDSISDSGEDRGLPTASVNPAGRQSLLRSQSEPRGATVALRSQSEPRGATVTLRSQRVNPAGQQSLCEARA